MKTEQSKSIPLKEIVGFLPYELKWNLPTTSERFESILENECYGIIDLEWAIENNYPRAADYLKMTFTQPNPFIAIEDDELFLGQMKSNLGWEEDDVYMSEMKPVLHPLSDLTKEITHNGETFIPIMRLFGGEDYSKYKYKIEVLEKRFIGKIIYISVEGIGDNIISFSLKNPLSNSLNNENWQKLYKWNFDLYDWIKDGLAIDINTLKV